MPVKHNRFIKSSCVGPNWLEGRLFSINLIKPQTKEYQCLPESEYLVMQMADKAKIKTVPHALIRISAQNNVFAYITKRIDRRDGKMLAMEDFCQLDGRLTEDKYKGSYERCAKIIRRYFSRACLTNEFKENLKSLIEERISSL